jgi:hypothetical protein
MNKKTIKLEELAKIDPFKVPEGYFERLTGDIMSQLPDRVPKVPVRIGPWQRMQPWVYMAAMFAGIALMIRIFVGSPAQRSIATDGLNLSSSSDIEDFYNYYESELAKVAYSDAFYLASYTE